MTIIYYKSEEIIFDFLALSLKLLFTHDMMTLNLLLYRKEEHYEDYSGCMV